MSMQGNIAVEGAMKELQALIKANADLPASSLLAILKERIEQIRAAAEAGWY